MSRGRTFSDSQDYDDELAELHDKRERELRLLSYVESANEDTDDASEDGAGPPPPRDEHQDIKEQLYHDKLGLLKANLEELEGGNHTEFNRELSRLEIKFRRREQVVGARWAIETEVIEREYTNERLLIVREFEEKKIELRESLIAELEEKRKGVEAERTSLELLSESSEVKPMNTRKLRRRPNEPAAPIPEKRRKAPNSQITLLLDDRTIDDDLKTLAKKKIPDALFKRGDGDEDGGVAMEARIEDGKLFYEKRWFHRGQPVFVEGKDLPRTQGIISGISHDLVWVRKVNEQSKIRVPIASLQKGKMVIKRRA